MSPLEAIRAKGLSPDGLRAEAKKLRDDDTVKNQMALSLVPGLHIKRWGHSYALDMADLYNLEADAQEVSREVHARIARSLARSEAS